MLRIAVPNKGSLSGPAAEMLHEAGYQQRRESKELRIVDPGNEVEFFYLRPRDIAIYVSSGRLDIGITGRDLLIDSGANAEEILPLGFARSTFRFATKPGTAKGIEDLGGMTVATSYEGIVAKHLADSGIDASVVHLDGDLEPPRDPSPQHQYTALRRPRAHVGTAPTGVHDPRMLAVRDLLQRERRLARQGRAHEHRVDRLGRTPRPLEEGRQEPRVHRRGEGVARYGGQRVVHPPRILVREDHRVRGEGEHTRVPVGRLRHDGRTTVRRWEDAPCGRVENVPKSLHHRAP